FLDPTFTFAAAAFFRAAFFLAAIPLCTPLSWNRSGPGPETRDFVRSPSRPSVGRWNCGVFRLVVARDRSRARVRARKSAPQTGAGDRVWPLCERPSIHATLLYPFPTENQADLARRGPGAARSVQRRPQMQAFFGTQSAAQSTASIRCGPGSARAR